MPNKIIPVEIEIPDSEASINLIGINVFNYLSKTTKQVQVQKPLFENDGITPILGEDGKQVFGNFIELQEVDNDPIEAFVIKEFKKIFDSTIKQLYIQALQADAQKRLSQITLVK